MPALPQAASNRPDRTFTCTRHFKSGLSFDSGREHDPRTAAKTRILSANFGNKDRVASHPCVSHRTCAGDTNTGAAGAGRGGVGRRESSPPRPYLKPMRPRFQIRGSQICGVCRCAHTPHRFWRFPSQTGPTIAERGGRRRVIPDAGSAFADSIGSSRAGRDGRSRPNGCRRTGLRCAARG